MCSSAVLAPTSRAASGRPARSSSAPHPLDLRRAHAADRRDIAAAMSIPAPTASPCSQLAVLGGRFDRVTEGVAEIQHRALALLALIARDDLGLDLAGAPDRVPQGRGLARQQPLHMASSQAKNAASRIRPYLMTSASPARSSRPGQGREGVGVGDHGRRLMKRPDQVLPARVIDTSLAADGGVDLREQRGRHLHVGDARAGSKPPRNPRDPHHPAAQGDHGAVAREAIGDQDVDQSRHVLQRLVRLPIGQARLDDAAAATGSPAGRARKAVRQSYCSPGADRASGFRPRSKAAEAMRPEPMRIG